MNGEFRVIRAFSQEFTVDNNGQQVICPAKKRNKKDSILAGDLVRINNGIITDILPRHNSLIRPPIANVDQIIIVVCPTPKPDFFMIDKMLINCFNSNIEPIICLNKSDTFTSDFAQQITTQYSHYNIITTNAIDAQIDALTPLLAGKITCLTGQSAVGKSTLINAILGNSQRTTGGLTSFNRGKNTTTNTQLFFTHGGWIADTPGFSLIDIFDVDYTELDLYYPEFDGLINHCKFHRCTHMGEPECAIQAGVDSGKINQERYLRYKELYLQLKEKNVWKK